MIIIVFNEYKILYLTGTVSIGTEILHGGADLERKGGGNGDDEGVLAQVDLLRNDENDQDDVVCSTMERTTSQDGTADCTVTDDKVYSASTCTASFSRSFSSDSADGSSHERPLFINVIESGDEFKTIMDRNNRARQLGSAIDEQVTYFPELFTHSQYKMYENSGKTAAGHCAGVDNDDGVDIYVPKRLDAEELRNRLRNICNGKKQQRKRTGMQRPANRNNNNMVDKSATKKINKNSLQNNDGQKKNANQLAMKNTSAVKKTAQSNSGKPGPRTTYYFELDPKGKLKPLDENGGGIPAATNLANNKFFRINLKAAKNDRRDGNIRCTGKTPPRMTNNCSKSPNTDLFLEFQMDKCGGRKGAKLIIKKKPPAPAEGTGATTRPNSNKRAVGNAERARLPGYNGLRSEYGLSAEQLLERRRIKTEREIRRREFRQKKHEEEQKKRVENEKNFYKWLQQKKHLKKLQAKTNVRHSYPINTLTVSSARTSM